MWKVAAPLGGMRSHRDHLLDQPQGRVKAWLRLGICTGQVEGAQSPQKLGCKRTGFITPRRPKEKQTHRVGNQPKVRFCRVSEPSKCMASSSKDLITRRDHFIIMVTIAHRVQNDILGLSNVGS